MSRGWVAVHRKIVDWEWYQDANTFRLFMHLLFKANYSFGKWRGESLSPGQLVTGRVRLPPSFGPLIGHFKVEPGVRVCASLEAVRRSRCGA
jgi:hypothetical protein